MAKLYKLKHLGKVEVVSNDTTGCTFILVTATAISFQCFYILSRIIVLPKHSFSSQGFDNLRNHTVAPPQWTLRNIDDRYLFIGLKL
jgi:exocyst complex component 1